mmetsp:Transcript_25849/g.57029  ORF Transcript_25849/g.57029 Transcript_25849/m.57029 type:complete len:157 (+) Transcript_25849:36-506(+)
MPFDKLLDLAAQAASAAAHPNEVPAHLQHVTDDPAPAVNLEIAGAEGMKAVALAKAASAASQQAAAQAVAVAQNLHIAAAQAAEASRNLHEFVHKVPVPKDLPLISVTPPTDQAATHHIDPGWKHSSIVHPAEVSKSCFFGSLTAAPVLAVGAAFL